MNVNGNINIEYEARVMITENQYSLIMKSYDGKGRKLVNTNYYFDDEKKTLTNNGVVLRVRNIDDKYFELTLKIKGVNGDKEINYSLTSKEAGLLIGKCDFNREEIAKEIKAYGLDTNDLKLITSLKTERLEIDDKKHLIVIDKNYYNNKVDFNIEVESTSKTLANQCLDQICSKFNIENKKDYISKSRRAIYNL